ncbi:MAG: DUF4147 domain-containing protein [Alphaproteobacteria bacterium GM7ARS4]|nr:DUF4147 domain-containing protein [Alphaproteobacteria bacterium GM7ARS4]
MERTPLREQAKECFHAAVAAADPYRCVASHVHIGEDGGLVIGAKKGEKGHDIHKLRIYAVGKASLLMMKAALDVIPTALRVGRAIAITTQENMALFSVHHPRWADDYGVSVYVGGHPVPTQEGMAAAQALYEDAQQGQEGEVVLFLVSGGGSALVPLPVEGVSLEDKMATTNALLKSGATIHEVNVVRKHLSRLKGGWLARHIYPARSHALILSDVVGDDVSSIASGMTVPDPSSFRESLQILEKYALTADIPASVTYHLQQGVLGKRPETLKDDDVIARHSTATLIGSNRMSVHAALAHASSLGFDATLWRVDVSGEARLVAQQCVDALMRDGQQKGWEKKRAWVFGGETTVRVRGSGLGGRNQELGVAFAEACARHGVRGRWAFLSGGTDGRDGPTDVAGALIDETSYDRWQQAGDNPRCFLDNNDTYTLLTAHHDALAWHATGTNVADVQIFLWQA